MQKQNYDTITIGFWIKLKKKYAYDSVCFIGCPSNYIYDGTTGLCIRPYMLLLSWTDAVSSCQSSGGHMLVIDSDATLDYVLTLIRDNPGKPTHTHTREK
jgi:hypothetical protein